MWTLNVTDSAGEAPHQIVADLQRRLDEALAQQAATAGVLKIITRSTFDLQTVLETLIKSAVQLCGANRGSIFLREGDVFPLRAASSTTPQFLQFWTASPPKAGRGSATARVIASGKIEVIADVVADPEMEMPADCLKNIRAALGVPMLRDNRVEGVMVLTRPEPGPFSQSQIDLAQTFADQAVIAIENARLFNETKEALERQTATADILKVIASSPSDVQPVFETIVQTGLSLFPSSAVMLVLAADGIVRPAAIAENDPKLAELLKNAFPVPLTRDFMHTVAILDGRLVDIPDAEIGPAEFPAGRSAFLSTGHRAITIMPMIRGDQSIGALSVVRRMP